MESNKDEVSLGVIYAVPVPALDVEGNAVPESPDSAVDQGGPNKKVQEEISEPLVLVSVTLYNGVG